MITNAIIKKSIKYCPWRNTDSCSYKGDEISVICKLECEPCVATVNRGKCETLISLFKEEEQQ